MPVDPVVAVITRTQHRPALLKRAAESVMRQTYKHLIWVVVNDGGDPDPVEQVVREYRTSGGKALAIHHSSARGMEAASNAGIAGSASELLAVHDDDDSWAPTFLEECVGWLSSHPDYLAVVTQATVVKERIDAAGITQLSVTPFAFDRRQIYLADLLQRNLFPPIALLFRRSAYDAIGPFDEAFPVLGDWEFNIRLAMAGDIGILPKRLANYHVRRSADPIDPNANSLLRHDLHAETDARFRNAMLRKFLRAEPANLGLLLSLHHFSPLHYLKSAGPKYVVKRLLEKIFGR